MAREGIVHHGIELPVRGRAPPRADARADRALDRPLRSDRGGEGPDRGAARRRSPAPVRGRRRLRRGPGGERPRLCFRHEGRDEVLECDAIAGCDGFHGVCRASIPGDVLRTFERDYVFGWLGILAQVAPSIDELVYSASRARVRAARACALPELSRYYIQCAPDDDAERWADDADLGGATAQRVPASTGWTLEEGPDPREGRDRHAQLRRRADAVRTPLPRRRRRAHRPRPARKGLDLALRDVRLLAEAIADSCQLGRRRRARRRTRGAASAGSGAPSISRGG